MPDWFQWVVFVVLATHAIVWAWISVLAAEDERRERVRVSRVSVVAAMVVASIACLTLWFIAGGGK